MLQALLKVSYVLKQLQTVPEVGLPLCGGIYNTVTRGARLKKLYIDSGSSGSGKSRRMVGNACNLAIPMYYDTITEEWINTSCNNSALLFTTRFFVVSISSLLYFLYNNIFFSFCQLHAD